MFFYKRSLARANGDDLRKAAEAVVDAAILCHGSSGRFLDKSSSIKPDLGDDYYDSPNSECDSHLHQLREQMIETILHDPARTAELFSRS